MAALDTITRADAETYARDGVVVVRGAFRDWMDVLRAGVERDLAEPGPGVRIYGGDEDGTGRFFGDYCNWQRIPEFRRFAFESPAAEIAAALLRSRTVRLFHEHVLVKEPGNDVPTPWHQDGPYYCVGGQQTISLWIPLDPVSRETTLEFVPGSHRWGSEFRPERFNRTALVEGDDREAVPDVDARREELGVVGYALEPGDAVGFNYMTLHGAPANTSRSLRRRAFSLRLMGDDVRFVEREGTTSPPFPGVRLRTGDALDVPEFPLLWPRP
jgi:ectoine hydroxylase-related dioxygenase (phytanoyl-CoA dioxygenase family)